MNLHKNARTCPKSRALMVSRVLEDRRAVAEVATEMGVSRRTVYKWVQRYCEGGEAALQDGSSEPGVLHHQLGQDWVDLIVELRTEYKMTALRIARQLDLARSTVAGVLQREGISQHGQRVVTDTWRRRRVRLWRPRPARTLAAAGGISHKRPKCEYQVSIRQCYRTKWRHMVATVSLPLLPAAQGRTTGQFLGAPQCRLDGQVQAQGLVVVAVFVTQGQGIDPLS